MNQKEWQAIEQAGKVLQLGERATLGEIKRAYYKLSKRYHPDHNGNKEMDTGQREKMYKLTAAYELLIRYCNDYRFPLIKNKAAPMDAHDPEQWWMERFGQDPLWGGRKR
ncbi:J domain-containing protein [Desulfogranum japonicum]|uniref:J domain-containing protein n=1 Tax=Desulfogranum japonicum TaxID=231447 RepID=UPI00041C734B|nr:J domain-containing protein [Desulfogranum japonicum]